MDFSFTPEQDEAAELAARILGDRATNERQKAVEATGSRFDADLWRELDEAGLLSLAVPEAHGGAGLGLLELCRVLVEVGRVVAPVPLAVHGPVAVLLAELGTDEQQQRWLGGDAVLSAAVAEERAHLPARPTVVARDGRLTGSKVLVRAGQVAGAFLVTASDDDGTGVWLLDRDAEGVTLVEGHSSDRDLVVRLDLDGAPADRLGGSEAAAPAHPAADRLRGRRAAGGHRGRAAADGVVRRRRASSSAARSARSRRSRSAWPTATSTCWPSG